MQQCCNVFTTQSYLVLEQVGSLVVWQGDVYVSVCRRICPMSSVAIPYGTFVTLMGWPKGHLHTLGLCPQCAIEIIKEASDIQ